MSDFKLAKMIVRPRMTLKILLILRSGEQAEVAKIAIFTYFTCITRQGWGWESDIDAQNS